MRTQHVRAMARKEWRHLLRDPGSLALILLMPAMLLFLFGYAIRLDITEAPLGVLQETRDAESDALVARFEASHAFDVTRRFDDRDALGEALEEGEVWAALVVPDEYSTELARGQAALQLLLDGVDANTARLLRNYALNIVDLHARLAGAPDPPVRIEERSWFNEARISRLAIVPGVIAVVMAVIGALMTSLTVAREMELGNVVMLRTTPLSRTEFLAGKLIPYFVIGMIDLLVSVAAAVYVFDVPLRGPFAGLVVVSALFLLVVMLQGTLISIAAGNQMLASQMSLVSTFLPAFLLSGFIFAIENMPWLLQYLTLLVPARYYVTISKAVFLKGLAPYVLWTEVIALTLILAALWAVVRTRARKLGLLD